MERQPRRKNEKRRSSRPTSNHNLALCRVVCRVGRSGWKRVCSFRRIILPPRLGLCTYKERGHIFTVEIHVRIHERRYAGLPTCIRLIYSTSETMNVHDAEPVGQGESVGENDIHKDTVNKKNRKGNVGSRKSTSRMHRSKTVILLSSFRFFFFFFSPLSSIFPC